MEPGAAVGQKRLVVDFDRGAGARAELGFERLEEGFAKSIRTEALGMGRQEDERRAICQQRDAGGQEVGQVIGQPPRPTAASMAVRRRVEDTPA